MQFKFRPNRRWINCNFGQTTWWNYVLFFSLNVSKGTWSRAKPYVAQTRLFWASTPIQHMSSTGTGNALPKSVPNVYKIFFFFFFFFKSGYGRDMVTICWYVPDTIDLKKIKIKNKKKARFWQLDKLLTVDPSLSITIN